MITVRRPTRRVFVPILVLSLSFAVHKPTLADSSLPIDPNRLASFRPETISGLQDFFETLDYNWAQLDSGVPPFILEGIPADIDESVSTPVKKKAFFMGLLPMVLLANQEISGEREEVLRILERHRVMESRAEDQNRLAEIMTRYGLRGDPYTDHTLRSKLLDRIDTIPPSLVLAQAANESAWGTSKFARLGNNLFGEWTFTPGAGIVPEDRPEGEIYEVRKFTSIHASIRSYMNNLNSHRAYARLRRIRSQLRASNQPVTGMALANGLQRYSERGEDYIAEIQAMIRQNQLSRANVTFLRQPEDGALVGMHASGDGLFSTRARLTGGITYVRHDP